MVANGSGPDGGSDRDVATVVDAAASWDGAPERPEPIVEGEGFRQSYLACADASTGATPEILDCIAEEFEYQDSRLDAGYRKLQSMLQEEAAIRLEKEHGEWIARRDKECAWDPETEGQGQLIDAKSCELNWTSARAAEIERRIGALHTQKN